MTADVNVTEKVARALWETFGAWPNGPLAAWLTESDCDRLAREALAAMSDPEVLAGMAGVLADHVLDEYASTCSCEKWEHFEGDSDERIATYTAHVATALADWIRGQG